MDGRGRVGGFTAALQKFGIGRLAAVLGVAAGVAAVLVAVMLRVGQAPDALLYSNLDLREAGEITAAEEILIPAIRRCVEHQSLPSFHRGLPIVKARFQNQPTIGGFALVKRSLLEGDLLQIIMEQK